MEHKTVTAKVKQKKGLNDSRRVTQKVANRNLINGTKRNDDNDATPNTKTHTDLIIKNDLHL